MEAMKVRLIFAAAVITLALTFGIHAGALAAGPHLLITWKATDSVAPYAYRGKVLPSSNAPITASVEAISAGGTVVSLKSYDVYWYLDDGFLGGGTGTQTITLNAPGYSEIMALRVTVPDYPGDGLVGAIQIQMADPRVVIVAPYPGGTFSQSSVQVQAVPYFFTTSDFGKLSFQWTVNDQAVTTQEDPESLTVNLGGGTPTGYLLSINLLTQQSNNPLISDSESVVLTKTN